MQRAFVYGFPALHSLSPAIHNAAFLAAGLDVKYAAREVPPSELAAAVAHLRAPNVLGTNVTVPHKLAVMNLVDEVDEVARTIGAANTIHNRGGRLWATNTDVGGFARSLAAAEIRVDGADVLLLGAGGSARAVAYALLSGGARRVLVANRTIERAERLAADMRVLFPGGRVGAVSLYALHREQMGDCRLVVNTTTVGMQEDASPIDSALLPAGGAVVDIIYTPVRTRLLKHAQTTGLRTLNGLPMLVHQAALAWEIWTDQPAPVDVMFEAVGAALARREAAGRVS